MTPLQDVTLNDVGLKAVFECEVTKSGLRPEWYKGDKLIKRDVKYDIKSTNGKHSLILEAAQAEDISEYTVKFDEATMTTAKLIINGKLFI